MQQLANDFWNFRGTFKVAGIIDVGTQMSLVRREDGLFTVVDSYGVSGADRDALLGLTNGGAAIDTIVNVHPFHTLHCKAAHELAPHARLYGTRRHREQAPELPWDEAAIENPDTQLRFDYLDFSIPDGLDLVTGDDSVHASSVLVRHRSSGIVHVDDTLMVLAAPGILGRVLPQSRLRFHPMLGKALQHRAGAADAFAHWAKAIAEDWAETPVVCAAHSAVRQLEAGAWREELLHALSAVDGTLERHRRQYG